MGGFFRPSGSSPRQFSIRIQVWFYDGTGTYISGSSSWVIDDVLTNTSFNERKGSVTVPAGASYMQIAFMRVGGADASNMGHGYLENPYIRRMNEGEMIVDGAITANKVSTNAITSDKIESNSIVAGKIASGAVSTDKLAANSVVADKIASGSITTGKIASNAITTGLLAAGAVDASAIKANAVTADKISVNSLSAISANLRFY